MKEGNIVLVRLKSGETHPANRVNLAKRLRLSQSTAAIFGERPGSPSILLRQSPEAFAAKMATDEFKRYGPYY